jgi:nitroreductase
VDVEQAVRRLRAVRRFRDEPLADADLRAILEAGRRSGSSKNLQRWHFVVVRDRATLTALAEVGPFAGHLATGAAAIALVTPDPGAADSPLSVLWDLGRAAQNMTLVAWARGVGSVPATVYDHDLCRRILGYPADQHCEYLLDFGYPANPDALTRPLRAGGRRRLDEVVYYERWGATAPPRERSDIN